MIALNKHMTHIKYDKTETVVELFFARNPSPMPTTNTIKDIDTIRSVNRYAASSGDEAHDFIPRYR